MAAHRRQYGVGIITDPDAPVVEMNTITCCHCQTVVHLHGPGFKPEHVGFCTMCNKPRCGAADCAEKCTPFELKLLRAEGKKAVYRGVEYTGDGW